MVWFPERLSQVYEVGPAASVAMHTVESGESAGWQGYVPAVGMAKRRRNQ